MGMTAGLLTFGGFGTGGWVSLFIGYIFIV